MKLFSTDIGFLKKKSPEVEEQIGKAKGVVDTKNGLVYAGPGLSLGPKHEEMERFGLTASDIAAAVSTAKLCQTASSVLEGDRVIDIRVMVDRAQIDVPAPKPNPGVDFNVAAAERGDVLFSGKANCNGCHLDVVNSYNSRFNLGLRLRKDRIWLNT